MVAQEPVTAPQYDMPRDHNRRVDIISSLVWLAMLAVVTFLLAVGVGAILLGCAETPCEKLDRMGCPKAGARLRGTCERLADTGWLDERCVCAADDCEQVSRCVRDGGAE